MELAQEDTQRGRYLTFALDREFYGLDIACVTEIVGLQPITQIPDAPDWLKGIINLRGRIIPVIDMRTRLRKSPAAYDDRTCIVVVEIRGVPAGLIVDKISEVIAIDEANIAPPPGIAGSRGRLKAIGKVGGDVKLLLDCDSLLDGGELDGLRNLG